MKAGLRSSVQPILAVYRLYRLYLRALSCQGLVVADTFDTMSLDTIDISHQEAEEGEAVLFHARLNWLIRQY
jgi:hypothetical protein